jgi:hypothetical protein
MQEGQGQRAEAEGSQTGQIRKAEKRQTATTDTLNVRPTMRMCGNRETANDTKERDREKAKQATQRILEHYYVLMEADFLSTQPKFENTDLDCLLIERSK